MSKLVFIPYFTICVSFSVMSMVRPDVATGWSIKCFRWVLRIMGYDSIIIRTRRANTICRIWNGVLLVIFASSLFLVVTGRMQ
jgi:hypothetical protein